MIRKVAEGVLDVYKDGTVVGTILQFGDTSPVYGANIRDQEGFMVESKSFKSIEQAEKWIKEY